MASTIYDSNYSKDLKPGYSLYGDLAAGNLVGMGRLSVNELNELLSYLGATNSLGRNDSMIQVIQTLLQQKIDEGNNLRDYERSLPANQVANLRAAGMSRSGAFSLLQNGGVSDSQNNLQPFQPQSSFAENLAKVGSTAFSAINAFTSLASLPMNNAAKAASARLMDVQGKSLQEQQDALHMVAHFEQACANAQDAGKLARNASLSDKLEYFRVSANSKPTDQNFDFGSFAYSTGGLFQQSLNNPFFYSFARSFEQQANGADASVFEPDRMNELVQSMQAAKRLTQDQDSYLNTEMSILQRKDRREALVQQMQEELDQVMLSTELTKADFDNERWERIINDIDNWTMLDALEVQSMIKELSLITDPIVYNQKLENLRNNEKVTASAIMHAQNIAELTRLSDSELFNDPDQYDKAMKAAKDATIYRELYGGRLFDQVMRGVEAGAKVVGAVGSIISAFKGTSLLPSVAESTLRTFGNTEMESHSVVESFGERTVQFHKYPHRMQD